MTPDESPRDKDDVTRDVDVQTGRTRTAWASGGDDEYAAPGGPQSATFRALAWSQDDGSGEDVVPYAGGEHADPQTASPPWYRRPQLLVGVAAALAAVGIGGLAFSLTGANETSPVTTTPSAPPGPPPPTAKPGASASTAQPTGSLPPAVAPPAVRSTPARGPAQPSATAAVPAVTQQARPTYSEVPSAAAPEAGPPAPAAIPAAPEPAAPAPAPAAPAPAPQGGPFPVPPAQPAAPAPAAPVPAPQGGPFPVPPISVAPVVPEIITLTPPIPNFKP
ncbi:MAG: hypothetical protein ACKOB8_04735 [Mycobacterium sp.]